MTILRERLTQIPCPICGNTDYTWGKVRAILYRYAPEGSFFGLIGVSSPAARCCRTCGNLQEFIEPGIEMTEEEKSVMNEGAVDITKQWQQEDFDSSDQ